MILFIENSEFGLAICPPYTAIHTKQEMAIEPEQDRCKKSLSRREARTATFDMPPDRYQGCSYRLYNRLCEWAVWENLGEFVKDNLIFCTGASSQEQEMLL